MNQNKDTNTDYECLEISKSCPPASLIPEEGIGILPPLNKIEGGFNWIVSKLPTVSALAFFFIALFICVDVIGRNFFNMPFEGIMDLERVALTIIGFFSLSYATISRQSIQIDLFYSKFPSHIKRFINLFGNIFCLVAILILAWYAFLVGIDTLNVTPALKIPEKPLIYITAISMFLTAVGFLFQIIHSIRSLLKNKEHTALILAFAINFLLAVLPFLYRMSGIKFSGIFIGLLGFALLMFLILIRVPLGFTMCAIGIMGMLAIARRPEAAMYSLGAIPYLNTTDFALMAFPMFLLMGEMTYHSKISDDLFFVANKWLGKVPGGLACAAVGGCAGFGAVSGDSMATVITMSSVALPAMREKNYDHALATGALAAGGTLGILIPPSMGFIVYAMITEVSVGKLFLAGILPGILLTFIFIGIIVFIVKRNPSKAPAGESISFAEKVKSLVFLIPVIILFSVVVGGILGGFFTPAEGGAIGAVLAALFAFSRRTMTFKSFCASMYSSAALFGKFFSLFIGLFVFGAFLASSRLPILLSTAIVELEVSKYAILFIIIGTYIVLGCVMNIMPMMMLTLPSIYPTIEALGFDGVWFGVVCVIVMEMGLITPPIGMNVFTLASMAPDIPMSTIFKGVLPFFVGMILCVLLLILFPQIALVLV